MTREFISSAQRVLVEAKRVESLADDLKQQYQTLFTFGGQLGSTRQELYIKRVEKNLQSIVPVKEETLQLMDGHRQLAATSENDLNHALAKLEQNLVTVQGVREELQREIAEIAANNRFHREKCIGGTHA